MIWDWVTSPPPILLITAPSLNNHVNPFAKKIQEKGFDLHRYRDKRLYKVKGKYYVLLQNFVA